MYDQVAVRESCYEVAMDPSDTSTDVLYSAAADHCTGMNGILVEEENVEQVALLIIEYQCIYLFKYSFRLPLISAPP